MDRDFNKRANMALNSSPEFKISGLKTLCSRPFGTLRSSFEQTQKSSTTQSSV